MKRRGESAIRALATPMDAPLPFKGNDFSETDVTAAA